MSGQPFDFAPLLRTKTEARIRTLITPELAERFLKLNHPHNRPMSEDNWMKKAVDMLDGRWKRNGGAIRFSWDGYLIDGQNRLRACIESGVVLDADVVFGLDPEVFVTLDSGQTRTAGNMAHMAGIANSNSACALAALLLQHKNHGIHRMFSHSTKPTKTQVLAYVRENPRISEIAGKSILSRGLLQPRIAHFCYYLFSEQDEALADAFFEELGGRADLRAGSPVHLLRERLLANSLGRAKLYVLDIIALIFKTWVAYRDGREVRTLRWRTGGPSPEEFPRI